MAEKLHLELNLTSSQLLVDRATPISFALTGPNAHPPSNSRVKISVLASDRKRPSFGRHRGRRCSDCDGFHEVDSSLTPGRLSSRWFLADQGGIDRLVNELLGGRRDGLVGVRHDADVAAVEPLVAANPRHLGRPSKRSAARNWTGTVGFVAIPGFGEE